MTNTLFSETIPWQWRTGVYKYVRPGLMLSVARPKPSNIWPDFAHSTGLRSNNGWVFDRAYVDGQQFLEEYVVMLSGGGDNFSCETTGNAPFSIHLEVVEKVGTFLYGSFYYRLDSKLVGHSDGDTTLNALLWPLETIVRDAALREHPELFELDASEAVSKLEIGLYGSPGESPTIDALELRALDEQWACFDIGEVGEAFDGFSVFAISNGDRVRVLSRNQDSEEVVETILGRAAFDSAFKQVLDRLSSLLE